MLFLWSKFVGLFVVLYATIEITKLSDKRCRQKRILMIPAYDIYYSHVSCWLANYHLIPNIILSITLALWCTIYTDDVMSAILNKLIVFYGIRLVSISTTQGFVSYRYYHHKYNLDTGLLWGANSSCSDLTISGHAGLAWLLVCDILQHGECYQKNIAVWLGIAQIYTNLAVGDHYTSDLFIGWILAVLIHTNPYI